MVIACKNQNAPIMNYLLGNEFEATLGLKPENTFQDNSTS